jgi:EmrB/QacA subfamily drug resistance transporter
MRPVAGTTKINSEKRQQGRISNRALVIGAIMVAMAMISLEMTIVSTAMPQIVAQLGGLRLYAWVFSSYSLAQMAMTVVFGKLADAYGRKRIMLAGITIFTLGSLLAGFAWSMPSMIVFRLIQGAGAGAILPIALTLVADHYPGAERGKIQGYLAGVWAISALLGPMAGAFVLSAFSWAWIFWMSVPIGIAAAISFVVFLEDDHGHEVPSVDYIGAALFTMACTCLMIAATEASSMGLLRVSLWSAGCCVCALLFVLQERHAPDPVVDFGLWRLRPIAAVNGTALVTGVGLMGLTTFVPMYVRGVLQQTPVIAGLALTTVMIGWPVGATVAARTFTKVGLRRMLLIGAALLPVGSGTLALLTETSSWVTTAVGSATMGVGMGLVNVSSMLIIQGLVERTQRASVTAANLFSRNLGSTLGVTLLGAVFNFGISRHVGALVTSEQLRQLLDAPRDFTVTGVAARVALQSSLHMTFCGLFVICLLSALSASLVPPLHIDPRTIRTAEPVSESIAS